MPDPVPEAMLVGDLLVRDRRDRDPALHVDTSDRTLGYRDLCTTAYKVGNVLSHHGVRAGDAVAVEPRRAPEPVLSFLGATLLGAVVEFRAEPGVDARAVVVHADREDEFDLPPGARLLVFGGEPERATTTHWEGEVWSENPAFPPTDHDPAEPAVLAEGARYSHRRLLGTAREAVDRLDLDGGSRVAVRASLSDPDALAAGMLAPLLVGGCVSLPSEARGESDAPSDSGATAAVTDGRPAPEPNVLGLDSLRS